MGNERKKGLTYWKSKKGLKEIEELGKGLEENNQGFSMGKIAKLMGIARSTLYEWSKKEPDIKDALSRARAVSVDSVENALFKKCRGYNATVKKVIKLKKMDYNDDGKLIRAYEEPCEVEEEVHVQADTAAMKFYLTNMRPEKWKANATIELLEEEYRGVVELPEVKALPSGEEGE